MPVCGVIMDDASEDNTMVNGVRSEANVAVDNAAADNVAVPVFALAHHAGDRGQAVHRYRERCAQ